MTFLYEMYGTFPRQIGIPKRYNIKDMDEFIKFVDFWNDKVRIFPSIYNYTADEEVDNKNLNVDKLYYDFDSKNCYDNIVRFHNWLAERNLKHIILFSGAGFHLYVFTKNYEKLKNRKDALFNAQRHLAKELGFSIGNSEVADIDEHIVGDVARIATLLGTWNVKRKRYCIGVTESMLEKGYQFIENLAKKQQLSYKFYGTELFDISPFDTERPSHVEAFVNNPKIRLQIDKDEFLKSLPVCVSNILLMKHLGFKRRGWVICYLRDKGYYLNETIQILEKYLSPSEFIHCTTRKIAPGYKEPGEEQPQYFYKPWVRDKHNFPGCWKLKSLGECPHNYDCEHSKKIYREV